MPLGHYRGKKKGLIYFLFIFQQAIAFVLPIGHALAVAMTIGHDATIPGDVTLISEPIAQQSKHLPQGKANQSQDGTYGEDHIQQEVLVWGHLVHS